MDFKQLANRATPARSNDKPAKRDKLQCGSWVGVALRLSFPPLSLPSPQQAQSATVWSAARFAYGL
jgi:hypothetical protein